MNITEDFLKHGHRLRPGGIFPKISLTIHSTGNPNSTAKNERAWLDNPSNTRDASWHYVVDEREIIQAIPDREEAWHCGVAAGNRFSIGIEVCESGDRKKAVDNAARLTARLLKQYQLSMEEMKTHHDWTGKNCPRILIDKVYIKDGINWDWFKNRVMYYYGGEEKAMEKTKEWKTECEKFMRDNGLLNSPHNPAETVDIGTLGAVMKNLFAKFPSLADENTGEDAHKK